MRATIFHGEKKQTIQAHLLLMRIKLGGRGWQLMQGCGPV